MAERTKGERKQHIGFLIKFSKKNPTMVKITLSPYFVQTSHLSIPKFLPEFQSYMVKIYSKNYVPLFRQKGGIPLWTPIPVHTNCSP